MAKLDKELKKDVELLLDILEEDYNEWLNKQHEEFMKKYKDKWRELAQKGGEYEKQLRKNKENL